MMREDVEERRRPVGRPRKPERREAIAETAAVLFCRHGFAHVSMQDIAESLGTSASALYRHVPGKLELLAECLETAAAQVESVALRASSFEELADGLAHVIAGRPGIWHLLRRESRHLPDAQRRVHLRRIEEAIATAVALLTRDRPDLSQDEADLRARCALAALAGPAQYGAGSATATSALEVCRRVGGGAGEVPIDIAPALVLHPAQKGRRDELLTVAEGVFSRRGFSGVSLDDLGAAVGMSGPSLYHHFDGKTDVLLGILSRAMGYIEGERSRALRSGARTQDIMEALAASYVRYGVTHRDVFRVFVNDSVSLPAQDAQRISQLYRRYMMTWAVMLEAATDSPEDAWTRTACAMSIVNDLAATRPHEWLVANASGILAAVHDALGLRSHADARLR